MKNKVIKENVVASTQIRMVEISRHFTQIWKILVALLHLQRRNVIRNAKRLFILTLLWCCKIIMGENIYPNLEMLKTLVIAESWDFCQDLQLLFLWKTNTFQQVVTFQKNLCHPCNKSILQVECTKTYVLITLSVQCQILFKS